MQRSTSRPSRRQTERTGVEPAADPDVPDFLEQVRQGLQRSAQDTARVEQRVRTLIESGRLSPDAVTRLEELVDRLSFYDQVPLLTTFSAETIAYIGSLERDIGVNAETVKRLLFPTGSPFATFSRVLEYQAVCDRLTFYKKALALVEVHGDVPDPTLPLFYERQALRTLLIALAEHKADLVAQLGPSALPVEWQARIARGAGVHAILKPARWPLLGDRAEALYDYLRPFVRPARRARTSRVRDDLQSVPIRRSGRFHQRALGIVARLINLAYGPYFPRFTELTARDIKSRIDARTRDSSGTPADARPPPARVASTRSAVPGRFSED
jgi:hypothetical protein